MSVKRRKPATERKEANLRARIRQDHKKEIKTAAKRAGISESAWIIDRLLKCARSENGSAS